MVALREVPPVETVDEAVTLELEDEALDAYSSAVSSAAARLIPSVASLRVDRRTGGWGGGSGSAVAFTPDGFLVTNAHVVAGAERGTATFVDGDEIPFEVVGRDPLSDLAVVRAAAGDLPAAPLGDAARLRVGGGGGGPAWGPRGGGGGGGRPPGGAAGRRRPPAGRSACRRDRQPARVRWVGDGRRGQRARPFTGRPRWAGEPARRERDPDR